MNVRAKIADKDRFTIPEFLAFYDSRPKGEKWELIEGVAILSPTPTDYHQIVCGNLQVFLMNHKRTTGAGWLALAGLGTRVPISPNSLPEPDVFVLEGKPTGQALTSDALVIFEVLSPSNTKADQAWRRKVYASVPNCRHYVTIGMKRIEVTIHDRDSDWEARVMRTLEDELTLPAIGVAMPVAEIYRYTPFGPAE